MIKAARPSRRRASSTYCFRSQYFVVLHSTSTHLGRNEQHWGHMQSFNKITIDSFLPPRIDLQKSHLSGCSSSSPKPTKVTPRDGSHLKFIDATDSNVSELSQLRSAMPGLALPFQFHSTHSPFTESLTRYIF
jgi:hypothetical protein